MWEEIGVRACACALLGAQLSIPSMLEMCLSTPESLHLWIHCPKPELNDIILNNVAKDYCHLFGPVYRLNV